MTIKKILALTLVLVMVAIGVIFAINSKRVSLPPPLLPPKNVTSTPPDVPEEKVTEDYRKVDFSKINPKYRFVSQIPKDWQVEFIPQVDAVNIYDPAKSGSSNLEKSQIFMRNFRANSFLTLTTVNVLSRESTKINGREAVRYEIIKKPKVPTFANQPLWRSGQHKLIDIRLSESQPSLFYVIAQNPSLDSVVFEKFIEDIQFEDDVTP